MKSRHSTFQVALACALGAVALGVVAVTTGYNIWLGILAGLITGYTAYEFRAVLKAVPQAFADSLQWVDDRRSDLAVFNAALTPCAVLSVVAIAAIVAATIASPRNPVHDAIRVGAAGEAFVCAMEVASIVVAAMIGTVCLYFTAAYFAATGIEFVEKGRVDGTLVDMAVDMSYARFWTLFAKGFGAFLAFLLWHVWIVLIVKLWKGAVAVAKGFWTLVVLIHSHERVLCAIDGTLGGTIAFLLFIRPEHSFAQNAVGVLFGMVFGAGWGLVNYEIVSKRILKVVPMVASSGGAR